SGASDIGDVQRAMQVLQAHASEVVLMQCNTNYTAHYENFQYIHLNVIKTYQLMFPEAVIGLSDHTPGHSTVLGAVALGARVVEKHFTDDTKRVGPDHPFSMTPDSWREMVDRTRELEAALGSSNKAVAENEKETVVIQRRCLRAAQSLVKGTVLTRPMIDVLRPAPLDAVFPYDIDKIIGLRLRTDIPQGDYFRWTHFEDNI
ncbi:MAG: N-acetylneuraminate synthase family protein, partial [Candidatus Hinthialibacter sp.]